MTRRRIALLVVLIALVLAARFLSPAHEQVAWWWAESRNTAADYKDYLDRWPEGRHLFQANLRYHQRDWEEVKNAMIAEAYRDASHANSDADAAYRREQRLRRENFFWKQVLTGNTMDGYKEYLRQYPKGKHVAEARHQVEVLSRETAEPAAQ